ncbi:hypothetical protein SAMN05421743_108168 [Thalassobacillus cyri]|uniref:Uncharacterized protein n=1 Tax=Thalassobacillus cyri TaxID=571932 RepID=A0A1H4E7A7_9BACI|nr:hypothetical protein SAMN05421743_108168 [Thalassobacillus cyri]
MKAIKTLGLDKPERFYSLIELKNRYVNYPIRDILYKN